MNLKGFEQEVFTRAAPHLKEFPGVLHAAIYETLKNGGDKLNDGTVRDTLARAGRLDKESRDALTPKSEAAPSEREPGIKHILRTQNVSKRLTAWAEGLREEGFFGKSIPPYKTLEDAASHIEESSRASKSVASRQELEYIGDRLVRERTYRVLLPYIKPPHEHVKHVYTDPESFWEKLAKEAERMAISTGFPKQDLVMLVLAGFEPRPPRARIKTGEHATNLDSGSQLARPYAVIEYNAPDLRDAEHRRYYEKVRGHVGGKGTNEFSSADRDLLELVEEEGGPPPKGSGAGFYRRVCELWNREYADTDTEYRVYKPDSLRTRYQRLTNRLG